MRSYIVSEDNGQGTGFLDPLGRLRHEPGKEPRRRVNIPEDYVVYFVFGILYFIKLKLYSPWNIE